MAIVSLVGYGLGEDRHGDPPEQNRHRGWGPGGDEFAAAPHDEQTSQESLRKGQQYAENELEGAEANGGCRTGGAEAGV
ncbi:hypothetical protein V492_08356 [Pseudogymnoascus sp. VKM F-4246]|nr:hypothetical protein V492_08356 [Pseudogymnoascus sp. VKM F-4246]